SDDRKSGPEAQQQQLRQCIAPLAMRRGDIELRHSAGPSTDRALDGLGEALGQALIDVRREWSALLFRNIGKIEHAVFAPVLHHFKSTKKIDIVDVGRMLHRLEIWLEIDYRSRTSTILHID